MDSSRGTGLTDFHWEVQPAASTLVQDLVAQVCARLPGAQRLTERLLQETGTRLMDWIDHLVVSPGAGLDQHLIAAGFVDHPFAGITGAYRHPGGQFPVVILRDRGEVWLDVAVRAESVAEFLASNGVSAEIEGRPGSAYRRARVETGYRSSLWVVERNGDGYRVQDEAPAIAVAAQHHLEAFLLRRRAFVSPHEGFEHAMKLIDRAIVDLGPIRSCHLFFSAERAFWQRRNHAARVQKARQDALGLGWANHDHHTYRSSRAHFPAMIAVFERLGFHCRERFYPGHNAGWGAQVLEHAGTGIVIFADVDMSEDEIKRDFAHVPFPDEAGRPLGTVGLWCALHGESFLEAGMHHLEATFSFAHVRPQLEQLGVHSMPPFTDYPHLRQCFTVGDRWSVKPERIDRLLAAKLITSAQAEQFRREGAIGSHLELLERNQGFKGFNQQGVDRIIAGTDPRHVPLGP